VSHLSKVSVAQRPRSGKKAWRGGQAGRTRTPQAGRPARSSCQCQLQRGPCARLAGKWGVCLRFGGNNIYISVLGVGGDTYGYPYFGGFLASAVPCGRCWLGDGAG